MKAETTVVMHHEDVITACREWLMKQGYDATRAKVSITARYEDKDDSKETVVDLTFCGVQR